MKLADDLYAFLWSHNMINNCNAFVAGTEQPVLFDPGHAQLYGHVENGLAADDIKAAPALVVLTHCHPDHMEAAEKLQAIGCKLAMHPIEAQYMEGGGKSLTAAMGMRAPELTIDVFLEEGDLEVAGEQFQVFHTPGHSPGHICIHWPRYKALFAGDLIFSQGVGRTDFPGGDGEQLKQSIERMAQLDLEYILPGHGPIVHGAEEITKNFEFIKQMYFPML